MYLCLCLRHIFPVSGTALQITPLLEVDAIKMRDAEKGQMNEADMKRYAKYIASDLDLVGHAKVTKRQMDRIKVCLQNLYWASKRY